VQAQYDLGVDPAALFRGLLETAHGITRARIGGARDPALSGEEREAFADWASRLGFAALHRIWQLLLKGLHEVETAPMPLEAAEMALLRIVHAAGLPDPGELARKLESGDFAVATAAEAAGKPPAETSSSHPATFEALIGMLERHGDQVLAVKLHDQVGLVRYAPPELVVKPLQPMNAGDLRAIAASLKAITGEHWSVAASDGEAEPSLRAQELAAEQAEREAVLASSTVKAALEAFPGAELIDYTPGRKQGSA